MTWTGRRRATSCQSGSKQPVVSYHVKYAYAAKVGSVLLSADQVWLPRFEEQLAEDGLVLRSVVGAARFRVETLRNDVLSFAPGCAHLRFTGKVLVEQGVVACQRRLNGEKMLVGFDRGGYLAI